VTDYVPEDDVKAYLNTKFGPGKWRVTSGYRSPGKENELRADGAGTVAPGKTSDHSKGGPSDPGALDIKVDGLSDEQVAKALKDGPFERAFAEARHGGEPAHVHADTLPALPKGFKLDNEPAGSEPPLPKGFKLDAEPTGTKAPAPRTVPPKVAPPPPKPSTKTPFAQQHPLAAQAGSGAVEGAIGTPETVRDVAMPSPVGMLSTVQSVTDPIANLLKAAVTGQRPAGPIKPATPLQSPYSGSEALDRVPLAPTPSNLAEGVMRFAGGVLGGLPFGWAEAAERGVPSAVARAGEVAAPVELAAKKPNSLAAIVRKPANPAYPARVERLANKGYELTPGQIEGGEARVKEQQRKSSRYTGGAIREGEQRAVQSFNRSIYDDALAPIGEKYDPKGPVGRDGIEHVGSRISRYYDTVLPKAVLKPDARLAENISEIKEDNEGLLGPYQPTLDSIIKTRVLKRLGPNGEMDGRTFKLVESDLTGLAAKYRRGDGAQQILADAIDQVNGALLDNLERTSPASVRPDLKKANTAWAIFKRAEAASTRRSGSLGVFNTNDLLQSVKKSSTQSAFGRGDALLSQEADDAHAVLGDVVPDSGTAGRINRTRPGVVGAAVGAGLGGLIGHSPIAAELGAAAGAAVDNQVGGVTNRLAAAMMRRQANAALARRGVASANPENYLKAVERRRAAGHYGVPAAVGASEAQQ
jgi:hypothetical protein